METTKQILSAIPFVSILDASLPCVSVATALNKASKFGGWKYVGNFPKKIVSDFQQAVENVAHETANKSAAVKLADKYAPYIPLCIDMLGLGYNIYKLLKGSKMNTFIDKDSQRGGCTKIIGKIGSYFLSTFGVVAGKSSFPFPGVVTCTGSALFKLGAKFAPVVKDAVLVGYDLYHLYKGDYKDSKREACTKIFGTIGSLLGSFVAGQISIPIPVVGGLLGSVLCCYAGKKILSKVAGFLFDKT